MVVSISHETCAPPLSPNLKCLFIALRESLRCYTTVSIRTTSANTRLPPLPQITLIPLHNGRAKVTDDPDLHQNKIDGPSVVRREDDMDEGNLAMTYSALATLITLEADLANVDGEAIVRALGSLQQEDGRWGNKEGMVRETCHSYGMVVLRSYLHLPKAFGVQACLNISDTLKPFA